MRLGGSALSSRPPLELNRTKETDEWAQLTERVTQRRQLLTALDYHRL
jgi:hypothetical protein